MPFVAPAPLEDLIDEDAPRRAVYRIADAGGDELRERTRRHTPIGDPTDPNRKGRVPGTARNSIERTAVLPAVRYGRRGFQVEVFTRDPVFPYIEWDTRPHVIVPRRDRAPATVLATGRPRRLGTDPQAALTWFTRDGGQVFARRVFHPGTRGRHPFARAALEMQSGFVLLRVARPALELFRREIIRSPRRRVA
mgnify:CR=1 FL=1